MRCPMRSVPWSAAAWQWRANGLSYARDFHLVQQNQDGEEVGQISCGQC